MEKPPHEELVPRNKQEGNVLSFNQKMELAEILAKANDDRNFFIKGQGGFDTFAEAGAHVKDLR